MPDARLILPYDVEGEIIDVLDRRHPEHLAAEERRRGRSAGTFQRFATMVRMSDTAADRLSGDTLPALLLGIIGAPEFTRNEENGIDAVYQLGMQITVMGQRRRDTLFRRDVLAWTIVECMYARVPRRAPALVHSLRLTDYEPIAEADTQKTLGDARLVWEVQVTNVLTISGGLPADDIEWPPEAGGPPVDPYDPIEPRPQATPTVEIDRVPIAE
jgi:hypothetical protein